MRLLSFCISFLLLSISSSASAVEEQDYRSAFLSPTMENRPLIIWQWMDGLVSKEAITKDLEAFKAAGLAGVQNFQIGGDAQIRVGDPSCKIGSDKWKEMMLWAMDECERLGLSFGTHNCPGWSSSAHPSVTPEYSMQKLVYSKTIFQAPSEPKGKNVKRDCSLALEQAQVDARYNYYKDICVIAMPSDSVVKKESLVFLTEYFDPASRILSLPYDLARSLDGYAILRVGHTTNGKTNSSQAPLSGQGLECDKFSRTAVKKFWDAYPQMIIDLAGHHAGKTFNMIEIDSYEAGGQDWSPVLEQEFAARKGYDIKPYLPYMLGCATIDSAQECSRFMEDLVDVATSLFAENYYGYMNELASRTPGMRLLIEPYGTGNQKPFQVLDIYKILREADNAVMATEFWVRPDWGWKDMAGHEKVTRKLQRPLMVAEAFTCWPLHAWKDDPQSLKPLCDKAFCNGVNRMMLHAGACNPWINEEPGMSFGIWGTHFVPNQTWWKAGGARALFDYMARCQSLLQRGLPAKEQMRFSDKFETYQRTDGANDIYFICNPTDRRVEELISLSSIRKGRKMELWDAYNLDMEEIVGEEILLSIEPNGSRFLIATEGGEQKIEDAARRENLLVTYDPKPQETFVLSSGWRLEFAFKDSDDIVVACDTLFDWSASELADVRYFSGTATYHNTFTLKKLRDGARYIVSLGEVKNLASIRVNGMSFPVMWKAPFMIDISPAVKKGKNTIIVEVTNLWPNRMIGDEQEPDDILWSDPLTYSFAPGSPVAGWYMAQIPSWLSEGTPRPTNRKTVVGFKYFTKDSPLLPSGLFGPVELMVEYGDGSERAH